VLLVHGIGDHREGDTLSAFGEPLVDWIQEWLFGDGHKRRGRLKWTDAQLSASGDDKECPAYGRVEFEMPGLDPNVPARDSWLLCEAHWGESVKPPEAFALMRWLWTRGPLVVYWHFYLHAERPDLRRKSVRRDLYPVIAVALAICAQIVVGLGMILLAIPIGAWRAGVLRTVRVLTLTLGDSYVHLERELQHAALVQRVRDALGWLGERVERVIVIGHSQGAALAYEALTAAPNPERVSLFMTLGSGLEKLQFLQLVRWNRFGILHATLIAPLLAAATGFLVHGSKAAEHWEIAVGVSLAVSALFCWGKLRRAFIGYRDLLAQIAGQMKLPRMHEDFEWLDIYTLHDIVPMGAASQLHRERVVKSHLTFNEGSYVRDHVSYFARQAGCLSVAWQALAQHTKLRLFSVTDRENLTRLAECHRRDVLVLVNARIALLIAAIGSTVAIRERLAGLGASVVLAVNQSPFGDWFNPIVKLRDATRWAFEHLGASQPAALSAAYAVLGALAPLAGLFIWWMAFRATAGALGASRWRSVARSVGEAALVETSLRGYAKTAVGVAAAYLPVLVAVLLYFAPKQLTISAVNTTLTAVLIWLFLLLGGYFLFGGPWIASRDVFSDKKSWSDRAMTPLFPLTMALIFFKLSMWMESTTLSARAGDVALAALVALYGLLWQVFALHRLRRTLSRAWLAAVLLVPPVVAFARCAAAKSFSSLMEGFYYYLISVLAVLGVAAFRKNRAAISAAFVAECALLVKRVRGIRLS
jgi:hypothetical protein